MPANRLHAVLRLTAGMMLLALTVSAWADASAEPLHPLKVVTGPGYPPFTGRELPGGGVSTRIIKEVFARVGYSVEVDFHPWRRGYEMARRNRYLGTFPYVRDEEREEDFLFSEPINDASEHFFVHADARIRYEGPHNLNGRLLCRPVGYSVKALRPHVIEDDDHLWRPQELSRCFRMLQLQRVDLVPMIEQVGWHSIRRSGLAPEDFRVLEKRITQNHHYFIVSRHHPQAKRILAAFNRGLEQLRADGTLARLLALPAPSSARHAKR